MRARLRVCRAVPPCLSLIVPPAPRSPARCSIACHQGKTEVAAGFASGALRVFDAASAELVHESRQHTGAVVQLAYARHGRMLLSLGEDGCVCAYNAERAYMPTTFLLSGFPLHATAMAASQDGQLLATAALCMTANSQRASSGSGSGSGSGSQSRGPGPGGMAQPVLILHSTLTMQPVMQVAVAGRSPITHLRLHDDRNVLAATANGRLLAYSRDDGSVVLDVLRCLPMPCSALALDPTGTLLVASGGAGQLKVLGLHQLLQAAPSKQGGAAPIGSLPSQDLRTPSGCAVLGAAFAAGGRQLLTVGGGGEVCCWDFLGYPCAAAGHKPERSSAAAIVVQQPALDSSTTAPVSAPEAAAETLAPWPLPAALQQCTAPRPRSARPVVPQRSRSPAARPSPCKQPQAGQPARSSRDVPFSERTQQPEASLLITAEGGQRCAQVVRQQRRLVVTSPCKTAAGRIAGIQPQRTAAWVDGEVAEDRIPPFHPAQQLQLLPHAAAVRHVHGFSAPAGFAWLATVGEEPSPGCQRCLLYAAGNVVCRKPGQQHPRAVARLPRDITALAVSPDGQLVAAASAPAEAGGTADIYLLQAESGEVRAVLSHPATAVTVRRVGSMQHASCRLLISGCLATLTCLPPPTPCPAGPGVQLRGRPAGQPRHQR